MNALFSDPKVFGSVVEIVFALLTASTAYLLKRSLNTLERVEMRQNVHDTEIAVLKTEVHRLGHFVDRRIDHAAEATT